MTDYAKALKDVQAAAGVLSGLEAAAEILRSVSDAEARQKRAEETVQSLTAKATGLAKRVAELEEVQKGEAEIRAKAEQTRQRCQAEIAALESQNAKDKKRLEEEAQAMRAEMRKSLDAAQIAQGELQKLDQQIAERKATLAKLVA